MDRPPPLDPALPHPARLPLVPLDAAMKRLAAALDQLEAATVRLGKADAEKRDLAETLGLMQDDRGRLAGDLDLALARNQTLERATDEIAARLGDAGITLRRYLAATEGA